LLQARGDTCHADRRPLETFCGPFSAKCRRAREDLPYTVLSRPLGGQMIADGRRAVFAGRGWRRGWTVAALACLTATGILRADRTPESHFSPMATALNRVLGDFDLDGKADLSVYHAASGLWFVHRSSDGADFSLGFGGTDYIPVVGDYDGDKKADLAVFHDGFWYIRNSGNGTTTFLAFGAAGYAPVPADYDGDGKTDVAVYHRPSGLWYIRNSSNGTTTTVGYGGPGYIPVPADYDGDAKADLSVYHQASGLWYYRSSATGTSVTTGFGGSAYTP